MKESHLINFNDQIYCFEISPYDWSQNLICVAIRNKIIIGIIKFPVEWFIFFARNIYNFARRNKKIIILTFRKTVKLNYLNGFN